MSISSREKLKIGNCVFESFLVLMLKLRIIPTILKNSAVVVKGKNFSKSRVIGPLLPLLKVYQSRDVDELIIIDVSPKKSNNEERFEWLSNVTSFTTMPLSVGGGIKTLSQASRIIELGADKVILNSVIQENPSLITSIASMDLKVSLLALTLLDLKINFYYMILGVLNIPLRIF